MKPATFAPTYACIYPELAEMARQNGYALAVHGSMARDIDLIAIPWVDAPSAPQAVVDAMCERFSMLESGGEPTVKEHGRIAYSLTMSRGFGEWCVDLSFMPLSASPAAPEAAKPALWAHCPETDTPCCTCPTAGIPCEAAPQQQAQAGEPAAKVIAELAGQVVDLREAIAKKDDALRACVEALKDASYSLQLPHVSCQSGLIARCKCRRCVVDRVDAAITQAQEQIK